MQVKHGLLAATVTATDELLGKGVNRVWEDLCGSGGGRGSSAGAQQALPPGWHPCASDAHDAPAPRSRTSPPDDSTSHSGCTSSHDLDTGPCEPVDNLDDSQGKPAEADNAAMAREVHPALKASAMTPGSSGHNIDRPADEATAAPSTATSQARSMIAPRDPSHVWPVLAVPCSCMRLSLPSLHCHPRGVAHPAPPYPCLTPASGAGRACRHDSGRSPVHSGRRPGYTLRELRRGTVQRIQRALPESQARPGRPDTHHRALSTSTRAVHGGSCSTG